MSNTFNVNQFEQKPIKGALDLVLMNSKVLTGVVSANQATALVPGMRVKLDTEAGSSIPSFVAAAATDLAIGTVIFNSRNAANLVAGQACEVAINCGPVMYCEADGAISAQAVVYQATGVKVSTTAGSNKKAGIVIDPSSADGDIIRVMLSEPMALNS
jgi:hypothetical protein